MSVVLRAVVTEEPLSVEEHAALVGSDRAGAVVTFSGVVRDHDGGRSVLELEYHSHPSAADVQTQIPQPPYHDVLEVRGVVRRRVDTDRRDLGPVEERTHVGCRSASGHRERGNGRAQELAPRHGRVGAAEVRV